MEASVDDLLRIIGEQTVQIRLLERDLVSRAPPQSELRPLSEEAIRDIRAVSE